MKTNARFDYEAVRHDQENEVHLVLTLNAPKKAWEKDRSPVCIMPVVDVSGSMGGDKIHYAKQSAMKLVEHLKPGDFAGLAVFTSTATLISPPVEMTQDKKDELKAKIGALYAQQATNFADGMLMGLENVNNADLPDKLLFRVIMLTDGMANVGVQGRELIPLLRANRKRASLSAFGYGRDAEQELLADLAKAGEGNYAFIQNPDDALSAFGKELGGLLAVYARKIQVVVEMSNGHVLKGVVSDVDSEGDDKRVVIKLPEILSEEERHLVFALGLSKQTKALPRATNVVMVKVSYDVINKDGSITSKTDEVKAKIKFVKSGKEQTKPTQAVADIVGRAKLVQMQIESEEKAKAGDYAGAQQVFVAGALVLESMGAEGAAKHAQAMSGKIGSREVYLANAGYFTSNKAVLNRGVGTSALCADAAHDVNCFYGGDVQLGTEAQQQVSAGFTGDPGAPDIVPPAAPQNPAPATPVTPESSNTGTTKSRSSRW
jgi:Mg-chelatase subunit ChlD